MMVQVAILEIAGVEIGNLGIKFIKNYVFDIIYHPSLEFVQYPLYDQRTPNVPV